MWLKSTLNHDCHKTIECEAKRRGLNQLVGCFSRESRNEKRTTTKSTPAVSVGIRHIEETRLKLIAMLAINGNNKHNLALTPHRMSGSFKVPDDENGFEPSRQWFQGKVSKQPKSSKIINLDKQKIMQVVRSLTSVCHHWCLMIHFLVFHCSTLLEDSLFNISSSKGSLRKFPLATKQVRALFQSLWNVTASLHEQNESNAIEQSGVYQEQTLSKGWHVKLERHTWDQTSIQHLRCLFKILYLNFNLINTPI